MQLTPEQREQIRKRQIANILARLNDGKSITAREQAVLDGNEKAFDGSSLSINQLAELTGKDRRTIKQRLKDLAHVGGDKGAYLYESSSALELIYLTGTQTLDEAKKQQALSAAELNRARREDLDRKRIPIDIPLHATDQILQSVCAELKASVGKVLTADMLNSHLDKFRTIPAQLKW